MQIILCTNNYYKAENITANYHLCWICILSAPEKTRNWLKYIEAALFFFVGLFAQAKKALSRINPAHLKAHKIWFIWHLSLKLNPFQNVILFFWCWHTLFTKVRNIWAHLIHLNKNTSKSHWYQLSLSGYIRLEMVYMVE